MKKNVLLTLLASLSCLSLFGAEPLKIGNRLELFVDRYLIEQLDGADLRLRPALRRLHV